MSQQATEQGVRNDVRRHVIEALPRQVAERMMVQGTLDALDKYIGKLRIVCNKPRPSDPLEELPQENDEVGETPTMPQCIMMGVIGMKNEFDKELAETVTRMLKVLIYRIDDDKFYPTQLKIGPPGTPAPRASDINALLKVGPHGECALYAMDGKLSPPQAFGFVFEAPSNFRFIRDDLPATILSKQFQFVLRHHGEDDFLGKINVREGIFGGGFPIRGPTYLDYDFGQLKLRVYDEKLKNRLPIDHTQLSEGAAYYFTSLRPPFTSSNMYMICTGGLFSISTCKELLSQGWFTDKEMTEFRSNVREGPAVKAIGIKRPMTFV